jgi:hypothetical protein
VIWQRFRTVTLQSACGFSPRRNIHRVGQYPGLGGSGFGALVNGPCGKEGLAGMAIRPKCSEMPRFWLSLPQKRHVLIEKTMIFAGFCLPVCQ